MLMKEKKKIEWKWIIVSTILTLVIFVITTVVGAVLDANLAWTSQHGEWWSWLIVFIYRLIIYFIPALILWAIFHKSKKFLNAINIELIIYIVLNVGFSLLALDYAWDIELFQNMDNYVLAIGWILTFILRRKFKPESPINEENLIKEEKIK